MAFTQQNLYLPARDLSNLAVNVDMTRATVDGSIVEAWVTGSDQYARLKIGSWFEYLGATYVLDTADIDILHTGYTASFCMGVDPTATSDVTRVVLFDESVIAYAQYSEADLGYYYVSGGRTYRLLKWFFEVDKTANAAVNVFENFAMQMTRSSGSYEAAAGVGIIKSVSDFDTANFPVRLDAHRIAESFALPVPATGSLGSGLTRFGSAFTVLKPISISAVVTWTGAYPCNVWLDWYDETDTVRTPSSSAALVNRWGMLTYNSSASTQYGYATVNPGKYRIGAGFPTGTINITAISAKVIGQYGYSGPSPKDVVVSW